MKNNPKTVLAQGLRIDYTEIFFFNRFCFLVKMSLKQYKVYLRSKIVENKIEKMVNPYVEYNKVYFSYPIGKYVA